MRLQEVHIRARRIDSHSGRTKTYGDNRTCTLCSTILSRFNRGDRCSVHETAMFAKYRARHRTPKLS